MPLAASTVAWVVGGVRDVRWGAGHVALRRPGSDFDLCRGSIGELAGRQGCLALVRVAFITYLLLTGATGQKCIEGKKIKSVLSK